MGSIVYTLAVGEKTERQSWWRKDSVWRLSISMPLDLNQCHGNNLWHLHVNERPSRFPSDADRRNTTKGRRSRYSSNHEVSLRLQPQKQLLEEMTCRAQQWGSGGEFKFIFWIKEIIQDRRESWCGNSVLSSVITDVKNRIGTTNKNFN